MAPIAKDGSWSVRGCHVAPYASPRSSHQHVLGVLGVDGDARDATDHVDAVAPVGLSIGHQRGTDRLPDRGSRHGRRRSCSRPHPPGTGLSPPAAERRRSLDDGGGKGSCPGRGSAHAPGPACTDDGSLQSSPSQPELRSGCAGYGNGRHHLVVEDRVAATEVREQPLQRLASGWGGAFLPAAATGRDVDLAPHRAFPPFFPASLDGVPFFRLGATVLGRRASSNMRSRSAARPPGGSGVLSPGHLVMSLSVTPFARCSARVVALDGNSLEETWAVRSRYHMEDLPCHGERG